MSKPQVLLGDDIPWYWTAFGTYWRIMRDRRGREEMPNAASERPLSEA